MHDVLEPRETLLKAFPELAQETTELRATLKEGLPAVRVEALREELGVALGELSDVLGIPTSTLARRRQRGRLDKDESERVYRITHLFERAIEVFRTPERARTWLKKPQYALGGTTPLRFADTEPGAREVERLLGRIAHGIPA